MNTYSEQTASTAKKSWATPAITVIELNSAKRGTKKNGNDVAVRS